MTTQTTTKTGYYLRALAALMAVAIAASLLAVAVARPAEAAFPGGNGRIFFSSDRTTGTGVDNPTGDYEIFSMKPDSSGLKQLTFNTSGDDGPSVARRTARRWCSPASGTATPRSTR